MITALLHDPATATLERGGAELMERWRSSPDASIWVILEGEEPEAESRLLRERFGIHPLAIVDALRERHPPKIEPFAESTFILLKGLEARVDSLDFDTIQLSLFLGERFLVTRSSGHSVSTAKILAQLEAGEIPPDVSRAALALHLCRTAFDRLLPLLLGVETRLEEMEAEMLDRPSDDLLGELVSQKADLKHILRILQYHTQVFAYARTQTPPQLAGHDHELNDVHEQLDRQLSLARLYYELTDDLVDGYLSLSAHKLNKIMQILTVVTVIFAPITFMAGIYGMNFEHMPELGWRGAYFLLLGAMLLVAAGILTFFHRRGWLRPGRSGGRREPR